MFVRIYVFLHLPPLANSESLEVNYVQLQRMDASLAYFLANAPQEILKIFDEVAYDIVLHMFPDYHRICTEIHVRITDLPTCDTLRDLR
jgi:DNA replication licensing factor MCM2